MDNNDIFLLSDKNRACFKRIRAAIFAEIHAEGIDTDNGFTVEEDALQRIAQRLTERTPKINPRATYKKAHKAVSERSFMIMRADLEGLTLEEYAHLYRMGAGTEAEEWRETPEEHAAFLEELRARIESSRLFYYLGGEPQNFRALYRVWFYFRSDDPSFLKSASQSPIWPGSPAYALLSSLDDWRSSHTIRNGKKTRITPEIRAENPEYWGEEWHFTPTPDQLDELRNALGLSGYRYIDLGDYTDLLFLDSFLKAIVDASPSVELSKTRHEPGKRTETLFFSVPEGPVSNAILETLGAGARLDALPESKRNVNHSQTIEIQTKGKSRRITTKTGKESITIEISDLDAIAGSNKTAKKMFVFALIKANEQALHNGQLTRDYITFPLQELVDIGFYSKLQSARRGFLAGTDVLTSMKIKGHTRKYATKKGPGKEATVDALEVLFTGAKIENGQCFLRLNYAINWGFLAQYFTILPRYCFKLGNKSFDLLYYIFFLARQNTREIRERGYFTISFRAIQARLQLPTDTKNPLRDIKDRIDDALTDIELQHRDIYKNDEFQIEPVYDENAPISDFLDRGYLKVILKGDFAQGFIDISTTAEKQIDQAAKKQARIAEAAATAKAAAAAAKETE